MTKLTDEWIEEEMKKFWKDRACVFDVIPDSCYEDGFIDALKAFKVAELLEVVEAAREYTDAMGDKFNNKGLLNLCSMIEKLEEKHDA